jgi:ubiquinone/menaquinone biosynthesis C-methylase UbiE
MMSPNIHFKKNTPLYNAEYGKNQSLMTGYSGIVNNIRFKIFKKYVDPKADDHILEIGCNDGLLLRHISENCNRVVGIDVNEEIVRQSNQGNIVFMSSTSLNFPDASFDKVYSSHVLEHIPDLQKALGEVCRVLRPGGRFISLFPYEPFRGARALKDSFREGKGLRHARQLHVHNLSPKKISLFTSGLPFRKVLSKIVFTPMPDFLVIYDKRDN